LRRWCAAAVLRKNKKSLVPPRSGALEKMDLTPPRSGALEKWVSRRRRRAAAL